jgi:COP9 signalosome complex subunit 6
MMATTTPDNSLLSSQNASELQVILHPLVLLTVSDYITRHTLRNFKNPVVGALLGRQDGREITIEHAFECPVEPDLVTGEISLATVKFSSRLEQCSSIPPISLLDTRYPCLRNR